MARRLVITTVLPRQHHIDIRFPGAIAAIDLTRVAVVMIVTATHRAAAVPVPVPGIAKIQLNAGRTVATGGEGGTQMGFGDTTTESERVGLIAFTVRCDSSPIIVLERSPVVTYMPKYLYVRIFYGRMFDFHFAWLCIWLHV
jgi:hypothetical protein